ncbi:MAG: chitobiase/beta-hexosaminidase C-terminal domain-containing protein, partial [Lachnospiraceae bacterium]|nr:chitobiase/beta-hexosaminidase C-terminal domain-containing protein [Lachnospiraceae bacterium]
DKYEIAFMGIGSKTTPYVVDSQEKAQAVMTTYLREEVNWKFTDECAAWMKPLLTEKKTEAEEFLAAGSLDDTDTAAVALQEKIDAVDTLGEEATAQQILDSCKALADAMEEYTNADTLGDQLVAKNNEASEMRATNWLGAEREAAVALETAIREAEDVIDNHLGEKTSAEIYTLIQNLEQAIQEYRRVHELDESLHSKIAEAEELKQQKPLAAERSETGRLNEVIEAGNAQYESGTAEELEAALANLDAAIQDYQSVYQLEQNLQKKITAAEKLKEKNELAAERTEAVELFAALDEAKAKYTAGTSTELEAALDTLDAAIKTYQKACQLQEKIAVAEKLKEEGKLAADSTEMIQLVESLNTAKEKLQQGTVAEQEAALKDLIVKIRAYEDASAGNFRAEARYSSYRIQIRALEEEVTGYHIFRADTKDGEYTKLTTLPVEADKQEYDYVDENVGIGVQRWYKVEAVAAEGGENITSEPLTDIYPTGIEAVQKNAELRQFHKSFFAEQDMTFDGNRMEEAAQDELFNVSDLMEGTFIVSYKPEATSGRKVIFTVKQANAAVGASGNLAGNTGMVFYQDGSTIRVDASHALIANWTNAAPIGEWSTFGYVNTLHTGSGNNAYTARNGSASLGYNRADMNGFIGKNQNLSVMTIGANKKNDARELEYVGEIAFVTITDEVFSQTELNAYTGAVNDLILSDAAIPDLVEDVEAVAGNGEVTLSWTAAEDVDRYEVSIDEGETWIYVWEGEEYTFTGLEESTEYTFLVRAANVVGSGETVSVQATTLEMPAVEIPVFSPEGGTYTEVQTVSIETATEGAVIYYTQDGSEPNSDSSVYNETLTVDQNVTIKAMAVKDGMKNSQVVTAEYIINIPDQPDEVEMVEMPVFSPKGGTYTEAQTVSIETSTEGAVIYYTEDGSQPTTDSKVYSEAIPVTQSMTLKAIAVKAQMNNSQVATAEYIINIPSQPDQPDEVEMVEMPVFSPKGGTYTAAQTVTIKTATQGAVIYYTEDGSVPTTSSKVYSKAITVDKNMTLKAIAVKKGMENSQVVTAKYIINIPDQPVKPSKPWIFVDVEEKNDWKHTSVKFVYENDVMGAITGTKEFQPDRPLDRAMFATVLYRMAGEPAVTYKATFSDVPAGKWYSNAILWANQKGIVSGIGGGKYGVTQNITREQIAKMLYEYADKVCGYDVSESQELSSFTDTDKLSGWSVNYMKWATAVGMISGKPNDEARTSFRLDGKGEATRAECAAMLSRFAAKY